MVGCRLNFENFFEENIHILLSILNGFDSDVKTKLLSFSLKFSYSLSLGLCFFPLLFKPSFLNDILQFLPLFFLNHIIQL
jgi:hypothetical protein